MKSSLSFKIMTSFLSVLLAVNVNGAIVLDPSFDGDGLVTVDFETNESRGSFARYLFQQPSQRLIIGGEHVYPLPLAQAAGIAFCGLTSSGELDVNFGTNGKTLQILNNSFYRLVDVKQLSDGRYLRLWEQFAGFSNSAFLTRYNANGSLDQSFSANVNSFGSNVRAIGFALRQDGKINVIMAESGAGPYRLMRLNANGSRDQSFGTNGITSLNLSRLGSFTIVGIHIQTDGKIVLAGMANDRGTPSGGNIAWALRVDESGNLDRTFGLQGVVRVVFPTGTGIGIQGTFLQSDGKLLLVGRVGESPTDFDFLLLRLTKRGRGDVGFGQHGIVRTNLGTTGSIESAAAVVALSDGKLVVVGDFRPSGNDPSHFAVVRYSSTGVIEDTGLTAFYDGLSAIPTSVLVQPDGKIVVAGSTDTPDIINNGKRFAIARFLQE